jgi:hypothetical protein
MPGVLLDRAEGFTSVQNHQKIKAEIEMIIDHGVANENEK